MTRELRKIRAFCLIFCLFGLGFASMGLFDLWQTRVFITSAEHTTGKVVGFQSQGGGRTSASEYPIYEFTDRNGQMHHVVSTSWSSSDKYSVGSAIPLLYDPKDPSVSRIATFSHLYILPLAFGTLGILAILISLGSFISGYKTYKC